MCDRVVALEMPILLRARWLAACCLIVITAGAGQSRSSSPSLADAHVHLSAGSGEALARMVDAGIIAVRDCGGDYRQLAAWRDDIAAGRRRGPKIYLAGPILDGPKPGAQYRMTITTPDEAVRAVDALARDVDFIKTHNAVPPEAFFAVVRRARERGLKVAAHLPAGVPAWSAAEAGVGSIEHAAESLVASPIYAGLVTDAAGAIEWWLSPAGDEAVRRLAATGVTIVPTLVRYEASINAANSSELKAARSALMPKLLELVGRLYRAGVPVLAGSDLTGLEGALAPEAGPAREVQLLEAAGLPPEAARQAANPEALTRWFARK